MTKFRFYLLLSILIFPGRATAILAQDTLSVKTLVEKNIQAAGGTNKLSTIKNYTFTLGPETVYCSTDGKMKIVSGKSPVISEVILVNNNSVIRNCFNDIEELKGSRKSMYQVMARLRAGLYTISKFENILKSEGLKRFGPKTFYSLSTAYDDLLVEFYLDTDTYTLGRIVLKGQDPTTGKFEINHDFGPYQTLDGIHLPESWFNSQVGTRGETVTIKNIKWNPSINKNLFSDYAVNVGEVKISHGVLSGQIVDIASMGNFLIIYTNWTEKCINKAGLKPNDTLLVDVGGQSIEVVFDEAAPSRTAMIDGVKRFFPSSSGPNYVILIAAPIDNEIKESLAPFQPIHIKKRA